MRTRCDFRLARRTFLNLPLRGRGDAPPIDREPYSTVRFTAVLCVMLDMVAVTVMTYVPGGVGYCVPPPPPPPPLPLPPELDTPQPDAIISVRAASIIDHPASLLRRRPIHPRGTASARSVVHFQPLAGLSTAVVSVPVVIESVALDVADPLTAMLVGLSEHAAFCGAPVQTRDTVPELPAIPASCTAN